MNNICNICGANYIYKNGIWICPACDNIKPEETTNEEVVLLTNAHTQLRLSFFEESEELFSYLVKKYPNNPECYWGLLLSKYGIKYEDDFDGKKIPTIYATSIESVLSDPNYLKAVELASESRKQYYISQAKKFEEIRIEWVEKAQKEKPVDIFICFKDSDESRNIPRTEDSYEAQNLYTYLVSLGYSVFFSRESLRDKIAEKYEPYIFNALNTAKVMIVYSSSKEYLESTWVKNEWSRFLKKIKNGEKQENSIVLAYEKMKPNDFPKGFAGVQCMNAGLKTFYTDLQKHISKVIKTSTVKQSKIDRIEIKQNLSQKKETIQQEIEIRELGTYTVKELTSDEDLKTKMGYKFLAKGLFTDAKTQFEEILTSNPSNGMAYIGNILAKNKSTSLDKIDVCIDNGLTTEDFENIINVSSKDDALAIIEGLQSACINKFNNGETETPLKLVKLILSYKLEKASSFLVKIRDIIKNLLKNKERDIAVEIEKIVTNFYSSNVDNYLEELEWFVDVSARAGYVTLASKFADKYLEAYPNNIEMLWRRLLLSIKCARTEEFKFHILNFNNFAELEKTLEYIPIGDERNDFITKFLNSINEVCNNEKINNFKDISTLFDKFLSYTSEGNYCHPEIFEFAKILQQYSEFDLAEKYFALIVGEDEMNYSAYWRLMQVKLKVKNNDELISQPVIISEMPEFNNAIIAAEKNEKVLDKYISIKAKQNEYLQHKKPKKPTTPKNKKKIKIISIILSIITLVGLGIGLYFPISQNLAKQENLIYEYSSNYDGFLVSAGKRYSKTTDTIPKTIDGINVVGIADKGFAQSTIKKLTIPNTIKVIGEGAFKNSSIQSITFNSQDYLAPQLKEIKSEAFMHCYSLLNVPSCDNLEVIGKNAFNNCINIQGLTFGQKLKTIKEHAFLNAFKASGVVVAIPKNVKTIEYEALRTSNITKFLIEDGTDKTYWHINWKYYETEESTFYRIQLEYGYNSGLDSFKSVLPNSTFSLPIPSRDGYSFLGWYYGEEQLTNYLGQSIEPFRINQSITVTAKWSTAINTLFFNGNGADSGNLSAIQAETNDTITLPNNTFKKDGYIFKGWSTTSNGSVEYLNEAEYTMGTTYNVTLYAVWEKKNYIEVNNDNWSTISSQIRNDCSSGIANTYMLTEDIENVNIYGAYETLGTISSPFLGTFDGNGFKIKKLYLRYGISDNQSYCNYGLFGYNKGTIKNLIIDTHELYIYDYGDPASTTNTYNLSLLCAINDGTIENCCVNSYDYCYSTYYNKINIAPFVAHNMSNGIIKNSYAKGSIRYVISTAFNTKNIGGFVGLNEGTIDKCYSNTSILYSCSSSGAFVGGFVGSNEGEVGSYAQISNSFMLSSVEINSAISNNFAGRNVVYDNDQLATGANYQISNCYNATNVASDYDANVVARDNLQSLHFLKNTLGFKEFVSKDDLAINPQNCWRLHEGVLPEHHGFLYVKYVSNTYPENKSYTSYYSSGESATIMSSMSFLAHTTLTKDNHSIIGWSTIPNGTVEYEQGDTFTIKDDCLILYAVWQEGYIIKSIEDWQHINSYQDFTKYTLLNDIDFSDFSYPTRCITIPQGAVLEGNNHTITNNSTDSLIEYNHGTIKNLNVINYTTNRYSLFVNYNYGTIDSCNVKGQVKITNEYTGFGGLCYANYGNILNSTINVDVYINNSSTSSYGSFSFGGICNYYAGFNGNTGTSLNPLTINNVEVNANINIFANNTTCYIGGLLASTNSTTYININNCVFNGSITVTTDTPDHFANKASKIGLFASYALNSEPYTIFTDCIARGEGELFGDTSENNNNINIGKEYTEDMDFSEYVSENDRKTNPNNVWKLVENKIPIFYDKFYLTLDNGLTGESNKQLDYILTCNNNHKIPMNTFENGTQEFLGWSLNGDKIDYFDEFIISQDISTKHITLYAMWGNMPLHKNINSAEDLLLINEDLKEGRIYIYILTTDIDLNNIAIEPIGNFTYPFTGCFIGNGYVIKNFTISTTERTVGLFGKSTGRISSLGIENMNYTSNSKNCFYGGIVGINEGIISNCYIKGGTFNISSYNINSGTVAGGLVAINYGFIENSYTFNTINIDLSYFKNKSLVFGGFVGLNSLGKITNCFSDGKFTLLNGLTDKNADSKTTLYYGGFVGDETGEINNCYRGSNISETNYTNVNYISNNTATSQTIYPLNSGGLADNIIFTKLKWSRTTWQLTTSGDYMPVLKK